MTGMANATCLLVRTGLFRDRRARAMGAVFGMGGCLLSPVAAWAQGASIVNPYILSPDTFSTLVFPVVSPDYSRGHNVAVMEEGHPDYDAPGAAIGSFVFRPKATLGVEADNNVYATDTDRKSDLSTAFKPGATIASDWSRHLLELRVNGDFRRYLTQSLRNRNSWSVDPLTELNFGSRVVLHVEGQVGRYYESPYSSDLGPQAQVLSNFLRSAAIVKATYTGGRSRFTLAFDHTGYAFSTIHYANGADGDQTYRNRTIDRVSGQAEFGISPSLSLYVATAADKTHYEVAQSVTQPALSSTGQNIIAGASFDLTGVMRGNIGVGYTHRDYRDTGYNSVGAFSVQSRLDFFPFQLTTVSALGQRLIQDSGLGSSAYIDTRVTGEIDQSLRENLIVILNAALASQSYVGVSGTRSVRQLQSTVQYQASRWLGFQTELVYKSSRPSNTSLGTAFSGLSMSLSVTVRR